MPYGQFCSKGVNMYKLVEKGKCVGVYPTLSEAFKHISCKNFAIVRGKI